MTTTEPTTVNEFAEYFAGRLERAERPDGTSYTRQREPNDERLQDLIREAHDGMLPDDYKYEFIREALVALSEGQDEDDARESACEPDTYTSALTAWLSSNLGRGCYVDDAVKEFGWPGGIGDALMMGQQMEREEVFASVLRSLQELADAAEPAA